MTEVEIETTCRVCGESFAPDHSAFVRGDWRTCPACRGDPAEPVTAAPTDRDREKEPGRIHDDQSSQA